MDLSNLDRDTTPEDFFMEILPEALAEVDLPDNLGMERLQINVNGDGGIELHIGIDEDGDLTIEEGQAHAPPIALSTSVADFRALLSGDLRDQIRAATGGFAIKPHHLGHLFLPDAVVQKIKPLNGNIQIRIVDKDEGFTYTFSNTLGGSTPDLSNPQCTVTLDVGTLIDIASGKEQAQQLFFQGRIRIDGDMGVVLGLIGAVSTPTSL